MKSKYESMRSYRKQNVYVREKFDKMRSEFVMIFSNVLKFEGCLDIRFFVEEGRVMCK